MNQVEIVKKRSLKFKKPIIILSVLSLVFTVLGQLRYFIFELWAGEDSYEYIFYIPADTPLLILVALDIALCVLLTLYVLVFYKTFKSPKFMFIFLGLVASRELYGICKFGGTVLDKIMTILIIITFALATIEALKKSSKKVFLIVATIAGLIPESLYLIYYFIDISWYIDTKLYAFTIPACILGKITFYVALLLFGLQDRNLYISPEKEKKKLERMKPEQALKYLKDKLDLGMITEEEYQAQRADIISKL